MTVFIENDIQSGVRVQTEELSSGKVVWVAVDTNYDGVIAQGDTREEALATLNEVRSDYIALERERTKMTPRAPMRAVEGQDSGTSTWMQGW
jgi:predicted RNase H-like HicB family nuclease